MIGEWLLLRQIVAGSCFDHRHSRACTTWTTAPVFRASPVILLDELLAFLVELFSFNVAQYCGRRVADKVLGQSSL